MPQHPHKLDLYRHAVQHPEAEVQFFHRAWASCFGRNAELPTRLREDFAGTAAVAAEWVDLSDDHRAVAVEKHRPTARWAERAARRRLGVRARDLHVVEADVFDLAAPRVDIVAATNFSAFIFHERDELRRYLRHARRCLGPRGLLVLDAFGGPGAMRPGEQARRVRPRADADVPPFTYVWEQRAFDHLTHRIDCRIHFQLGGSTRRDAFRYDWRLWTLPELLELMAEAGFDRADAWCDEADEPGRYRPLRRLPAREDWVAYVIGVKGAG